MRQSGWAGHVAHACGTGQSERLTPGEEGVVHVVAGANADHIQTSTQRCERHPAELYRTQGSVPSPELHR